MLHGVIIAVGLYILGLLSGIGIVRYGIGLGSKLHVRAKSDLSLDEDTANIDQEFTH